MSSIAYTVTPNSINLLLRGRMRTIAKSHLNFTAVSDALKNLNRVGWSPELEERIAKLVDIPAFIAELTEGKIQIGGSSVLYDGKETHGHIADRLVALLRGGFDVRPLARFLERLMQNPILTVPDELYVWMTKANLPLTDDGCLIAFKKVADNYKSYHDGETDNSIGTKLPVLDEDKYDTDRFSTCSSGYHFCSFEYLRDYYGNQGRVVICKVAPEDVVAIPNDSNDSKGRAKTYEIIGEVPEDEAGQFFTEPVVDKFGVYEKDVVEDYPWDEDDYEDDYANYADDDYDDMWKDQEGDDGAPRDNKVLDQDPPGMIALKREDVPDLPDNEGVIFFTIDLRKITDVEVKKIVDAHGHKGASRLLNVSLETIGKWVEWLKK